MYNTANVPTATHGGVALVILFRPQRDKHTRFQPTSSGSSIATLSAALADERTPTRHHAQGAWSVKATGKAQHRQHT